MIVEIIRRIDASEQIKPIIIKQHDNLSRKLKIQIFNNDLSTGAENVPLDLSNCAARLYMALESNKNISFLIDGTVDDASNGTVSFIIPSGALSHAGNYKSEIEITDLTSTHAIYSSQPFVIAAVEAVKNDAAIEATPEYSALENALYKVDVANARLDTFISSTTPATDYELIDIRTGWDGTEYESAGGAVRGQIEGIYNQIIQQEDYAEVLGNVENN